MVRYVKHNLPSPSGGWGGNTPPSTPLNCFLPFKGGERDASRLKSAALRSLLPMNVPERPGLEQPLAANLDASVLIDAPVAEGRTVLVVHLGRVAGSEEQTAELQTLIGRPYA